MRLLLVSYNLPVNSWLLLDSGKYPAAFNMALDEALLEAVAGLHQPVLRFYGWTEPAATFGYFQKYAEVEQAIRLRPLVRRPTGGGIVPHDADWTYSLAFPPDHEWHRLKAEESYRRMHAWIQQAFGTLEVRTELAPDARKTAPGQCFAGHEKSDLLWNGRKIAGAAQRRNKLGLLIQGSVQPPPISLAGSDWQQAMLAAGRDEWQLQWSAWEVPGALRERAESLARQKYSQPEFITKR